MQVGRELRQCKAMHNMCRQAGRQNKANDVIYKQRPNRPFFTMPFFYQNLFIILRFFNLSGHFTLYH